LGEVEPEGRTYDVPLFNTPFITLNIVISFESELAVARYKPFRANDMDSGELDPEGKGYDVLLVTMPSVIVNIVTSFELLLAVAR